MPRKPKETRELRVVLDTNALFTSSGEELVNHETVKLINENKQHADLKISWLMPEIVFEERLFQMRKQTLGLIQNVEKVEKLLGHKLALTKEILDQKVLEVAKKKADSLGIDIIPLDDTKVDWKSVSFAAVRREAPFEKSEKEKGFRDALIGHTFLQISQNSPKSATKCRVVLISGDQLLSDFVRNNIGSFSNVQIFESLEELKGLINTLASQVDESFVTEIQKKARQLFFIDSDSSDAIYYKEKISERINADFNDELKLLPDGGLYRTAGQIFISPPRFIRKERQRMYWVSRITFTSKVMKRVGLPMQPGGLMNLDAPLSSGINSLGTLLTAPQGGLGSIPPSEFMCEGRSTFDIHWSTTVNNKKLLTHPSIDLIDFVETSWQ